MRILLAIEHASLDPNGKATLAQQVKRMDAAQGDAKINAMAAVIDELVKQREQTHQQMTLLQERMLTHLQRMQEMMGRSRAEGSRPEMGPQASR
jgi:hypothetical protein